MKKYLIMMVATFTLMISMCVCAYASDLPLPPTDNTNNAYLVYKNKDDGYYYAILYNYNDWTPILNGSNLTWIKHRETAYIRYLSVKSKADISNGWGTFSQLNNGDSPLVESVILSNRNICDSSGKVVFRVPPKLREETEKALKKFQITTGGTTNTLILCGVGCLACLMGLKIFGKVFAIFHH